MKRFLRSVVDVLLDRSPDEWIGAIIVALFLAVALAGVYSLCRRWMKNADDTVRLVGPAIVAIVAGMVISAGYVQLKLRTPDHQFETGGRPWTANPQGRLIRGRDGISARMADRIFEASDADRDGRLSAEEAAAAASEFVKDAGVNGGGSLDHEAMIAALRDHLRHPDDAPRPVATPAPAPGRRPRTINDSP